MQNANIGHTPLKSATDPKKQISKKKSWLPRPGGVATSAFLKHVTFPFKRGSKSPKFTIISLELI